MKVLLAASECVPFIKTGGLADVAGALPKALKAENVDIRIVIPCYSGIAEKYRNEMQEVCRFNVQLGWRNQMCIVKKLDYEDIPVYFIGNDYYFDRPFVYGMGGDEPERYAFFSKAILEMLPQVDFIPDILHCNDWQTGLVPALLRIKYADKPEYAGIRTVYTIHNLQYQGVFNIGYVENLLELGNEAYLEGGLEFYGECSFMKGGINFADAVNTVSPTYAKEIQTPDFGERLDGLMRWQSAKVCGILNGIDMQEYDPETDPLIPINYSWRSIGRKSKLKVLLKEEVGLAEDIDAPLIGMVGRLSSQKGLDLLGSELNEIIATGAQLIVLGKGDEDLMNMLNDAMNRYPGRIAARFEMNNPLAHRIYAASDLFLMPSKFEPCGLSQMIALRYGTLPIVRETGGLKDTVQPYNQYTDEGNGFSFTDFNASDMLNVIRLAVGVYNSDKKTFTRLARRAMRGSYGWDQSAKRYVGMYERILGIE